MSEHRTPSAGFAPEPAETGTVGSFSVNRFTAQFSDRKLEAEFDEHLFENIHKKETPPNVLSALVVFAALGLLDWYVVPEVFGYAALLRFAVVVPIFAALFGLSLTRWLRHTRPAVPAIIAWAGTAQFVAIGLGAGGEAGILYRFFTVVFVLLPPLIGRSSVGEAFVIGAGCFAIFNGAELAFGEQDRLVWTFIASTYAVCWGYATYGAWIYHMAAHHDFWQSRIIDWQMSEIASEREKSERLLLNVLPSSIAARLKSGEQVIADSHRTVTVLFADISGFTVYSAKVTPEQLVQRLNAIFSAFDDMIGVHGLEKIKTIGDAYMVAAGLPEQCDDHADRMARFALGMLRVIDRVNADTGEEFAMRIGLHSGPVVAGVIGKHKFTYDLWGDTVNTASRMESHGERGRVQLSEAAAANLSDRFEVQERGAIKVKGKGEMRTFWLVGEAEKSS